jgi:hypothetical protein
MNTVDSKHYQISREQCQANINGVCNGCGGELVPCETVDNANNPTFWPGCEKCSKFCWGVKPETFEIARKLFDEQNVIAYSHMDNPNPEDGKFAIEYYRASQISGNCSLVMNVLRFADYYSLKEQNEKLREALIKWIAEVESDDLVAFPLSSYKKELLQQAKEALKS